ncbi:MAG: hypothetical protein WBE13_18420, partial [Candidatus Acidiferrum sp.]
MDLKLFITQGYDGIDAHGAARREPASEAADNQHERDRAKVTSPSFCTTANERVYTTTSSGKGANGGSQGAVG